MYDLRIGWSPTRQPSAFIPIAISIAALGTVLYHVAMFGLARETDEGAVRLAGAVIGEHPGAARLPFGRVRKPRTCTVPA
jgi:hypothetical protein